MDETDLRICQLLIQNARSTHREMADRLGLSVQAVHRRLQELVAAGVIASFRARLSGEALGAVVVDILGTTNEVSFDALAARLSEDDRVATLYASSGRTVFISGLLRSVSELGEYVEWVKENAGMKDATVGLLSMGRVGETTVNPGAKADRSITSLDRRIIASLSRDARRPVEELAVELRIATSTARRRLQRLIDERLIDLSIDLYPGRMPGAIAMVWLHTRPGDDRMALAKEVVDRYGPRVLLFGSYGNLPDLLAMMAWSKTLADQSALEADLSTRVREIHCYILQRKQSFSTWVDRESEMR